MASTGDEARAPFALDSSELNGTVQATRRFGAAAPSRIEPLSAARYKVQFTAGAELKAKLERAKNLLSHAHPSGDLALIVERGIDLLIAELERKRLGKLERARAPRPDRSEVSPTMGKPETSARAAHTEGIPVTIKPEAAAPTKKSRAIPRATRREVFERDGERCCFIDSGGRRCPASAYLEIDHIRASALGGGNESENLRVYCRAHNRLVAELTFGREHIADKIDLCQRKCRATRQAEKTGEHVPDLSATMTETRQAKLKSETASTTSYHHRP